MMRLRDYLHAAIVDRNFGDWPYGWTEFRERAACLFQPHRIEYDKGYHWTPPSGEPYCPRCGYDFAAGYRSGELWQFAPFTTATVLRYYDVRQTVCWWFLAQWGRLDEFVRYRVLRQPEPEG